VLAQSVQIRTDSGEAAARQIVQDGSGKGLMDRITMMLDTIVGEENQRLAERKVEWERDDVETRMLIAVGSGATMLLLALAALMLRRNAEQRRETERDREQQQRRVLERSQADLREMTLRNTASQYARSLLEASLDPLITINTEGKITDLNQATVKVTGKPRELLIGTDFSDYFTEPEKAREGYQRVFAEGSVTDYPLTIRHRDQTLTDVLYNASVYTDPAGNVLGVFAAARDITKQKQAEAAITRQRTEELERLAELERFKTLTVGRELKMIELKKRNYRTKENWGKSRRCPGKTSAHSDSFGSAG